MNTEEKNILIAEIIAKQICGEELSLLETDFLARWLDEDSGNRAYYAESMGGAGFGDYSEVTAGFNKQKTWAAIDRKVGPVRRRRTAAWLGWAVAAAMLVGAVVVPALLREAGKGVHDTQAITAGVPRAVLTLADGRSVQLSEEQQGDKWQDYVDWAEGTPEEAAPEVCRLRINVPRGGEFHLTLPDGSAVWLNSETVLEYPEYFTDKQRDIYLTGEAFFDVTPDPSRPFVITTQDDLEVTVLGTKFNVQSYDDAGDACVTLVEGAVAVRHEADYIELRPNQQALFDRAGGGLRGRRVADASVYAAWINGRFDFEAVTLGVIIGAMEKWYDVSIVCDESVTEGGERYTIKFSRRSDITQTLDIMRDVAGFDYRIEGKTVYLYDGKQ